jgi:3-methyl-2-oxobutanoate hydroxymethyltransferase
VQGRDAHAALALFRSAHALQRAGACMVILEAIPHQLATYITSSLVPPLGPSPAPHRLPVGEDDFLEPLPTIGIGAGPGTSGQVLVQEDMLGFWTCHRPKFVRQFMPPPSLSSPLPSSPSTAAESPIHATSIGDLAVAAAKGYVHDVRTNNFPSIERGETYDMDPKEWESFLKLVKAEEPVSRNGESRFEIYH